MTNAATERLVSEFLNKFPLGAAESFEDMTAVAQHELFEELIPENSAVLMKRASAEVVSRLAESGSGFLKAAQKADPADVARVIGRLDKSKQESVLAGFPKDLAGEIESIVRYPAGSAGSLMDARVSLFHPSDRVDETIERLRTIRSKNISSIFLVDFDGVLVGRVYLQDLIGAGDDVKLEDLAKSSPWVGEMAPKDEIVEVVEKNKIPSIPVLNNDMIVIGVIRYDELVSIVHQDALVDIQKMVGVSKEEKALSSPLFSVKKRLPWLTINLLTTFVAAFVVGMFEDTIAKITALAVLLPVVAGQSGNTGAQAQAVTMRGLALREIRMRHKWRVLLKEGTVGFVNGVAVGVMCTISVFFWSGSWPLAFVIGSAMIFAMVAASLSGAGIPMILTAIGQDPATSSSIILTTITDIVGFMSFLGLAAIFGNYLI